MENRKIPFSPPDVGDHEIEEVILTMRSGWITTGPRTKLLERRLAAYIETGRVDIDCNTEENRRTYSNRVACLNSATASEELNLRILGVGPGDEVIVPAYTYTATASAALHCGADVIFVDCQKDGNKDNRMPEMDYDKMADAITWRTKAVVPVDLGGLPCDYDRIYEVLDSKRHLFRPMDDHTTQVNDLSSRIQHSLNRVAVVADCAHSLGAGTTVGGEWRNCGDVADFSSFSFHAVKGITTAEGGAATWRSVKGVDDAELYKFYQLFSLHGQNKDALAKTQLGGWEYDIVGAWYKCNMTDIMAAMGLRQLNRYPGLIQRRRQIVEAYDKMCDELGVSYLRHTLPGSTSSYHLYLTRIPGITEAIRNEIIIKLAERGVVTNVHYKPLPMMSAYRRLSGGISLYPNAYDYYHNLITLPCHTLMSDDDLEYVIAVYKDVVQRYV